MKVADIKLGWTKSPSADIDRVEVFLTKNGSTTMVEFGPEVQEYMVTIDAMSVVSFKIVTWDTEGFSAESEVHNFSLGDLENPQPASGLFHEIVGVRDV